MQIKLSLKIYPLEAILNACYMFIDRAYIFLDFDSSKNKIKVSIKAKGRPSGKRLNSLSREFKNELLHATIRYNVSANNKKIREYIINSALYSALPVSRLLDTGEQLDYQRDPLGIAVPWEEKYGKKKNNAGAKI